MDPSPPNVTEQPPEHGLGTVAERSTRPAYPDVEASVTVSAAPAQACETFPTVTLVTAPALSTARENVRAPLWQPIVAARPAARPEEPTSSVAAAPKPAARSAPRTARRLTRRESLSTGGGRTPGRRAARA